MKIITVFFGMTASGKSTLSRAWAERCGAVYYNTDRVRKELAGLQPIDRRPDGVGQGIYTAAFTEKTYASMLDRASDDFAKGAEMVVLDGSFSRRSDRDQVRRLAADRGLRCVFVFCTCSDAEVQRRLAVRARDPEAVSDGRWEIYLHQKKTFDLPGASEERYLTLNTEQGIEAMLDWLAAQPLLQG